jgi:hypothetical protein
MPEPIKFLELNRSIWGDNPGSNPGGFWGWLRTAYTDWRISGFENPGAFITSSFPLLFGFAGLILFVMLIWGSMEILMAAANAKLAESGKKRITNAVIGFFILFSAFWIAQIITTIFGLDIGLSTP